MVIFCAFWIIFTQILFKFFGPKSECFATYDAICFHIIDYARFKAGLHDQLSWA